MITNTRGVGRGAAGLRCSPFFLRLQKNPKGTPLIKLKIGSKKASWQPFLALFVLGSPFKKFLPTSLDYAKTVHNVERKQSARNVYNVANERRLLIRTSWRRGTAKNKRRSRLLFRAVSVFRDELWIVSQRITKPAFYVQSILPLSKFWIWPTYFL